MSRAAYVCLLAAVSACSLLTSLDGLTGGSNPDGGGADGTIVGDGAPEAAPLADSGDGGDADGGLSPSQLYALAVLSDKPRGYWRLEETTGGDAKDEIGKYTASYVASPIRGEPGVAGSRAVKMPKGTNARILVDSMDFRYVGNSPYTVELWVKVGELRDYQWLGGTESGVIAGARRGWSLLVDALGEVHYEVWRTPDGGGPDRIRGLTITNQVLTKDGSFHHIVMAYDGVNTIGYLDGVQKAPYAAPAAASDDPGVLLWGCRGDPAHCLDDWTIDELAIYDVALEQSRVLVHYDLGK